MERHVNEEVILWSSFLCFRAFHSEGVCGAALVSLPDAHSDSTTTALTHPAPTLDPPSTTAARITASADPTSLPRRRYLTPRAFQAHLPRPSPFPLLHGMVLLMLSLCHWRASRDGLRLSASAEAESSFAKGSSTASRAVLNGEAGSSNILGTGSLPRRATTRSALYGACFCVHNCSASQPALLLLLLPRLRRMPVQCYY